MRKIFVWAFLLTIYTLSCNSRDNCQIIETYSNGKTKTSFCIQEKEYRYYRENGKLRFIYQYNENEEFSSNVLSFDENENLEAQGTYLDQQKHGDWFFYDDKRRVEVYNYFWQGNDLFVKEYNHQKGTSYITYVPYFEPDLESFKSDSLTFYVGLPLPDSLLENTDFYFIVGVSEERVEAKDLTFNEEPKIKLPNKTLILRKVKLIPQKNQYLFGYLFDEQNNEAFLLKSMLIKYDGASQRYQVIDESEPDELDSLPFEIMI